EGVAEALVDLVLPEALADVLDGVLGGEDLDPRLIHALERAEQGGALAGAGGAGDQDDPGGRTQELAHPCRDWLTQPERFHGLRQAARVQDPDDGVLAVVAGDDRDPEVDRGDLTASFQARPDAAVLR